MKNHVIAKAGDFKFTGWQAKKCINNAKKYDVICEVVDKDMALFSTNYKLMLDGTEKNIEEFLNYLKMMGFKIKKIC